MSQKPLQEDGRQSSSILSFRFIHISVVNLSVIHKDLESLGVREWSNLSMIRKIYANYVVNMASSLEKNSAAVINSNTVAVLLVQKLQVTSKEALNENLVLDSYHTVNSVCQNDHSVDYHSKISNNGSSSSNNAINSTSETLSISKRPSSSAPATATETSSGKRRKYLTTAKFKCMSVEKRLITLNEY
ncbi:hypothetical protein BD408DRAFT_55201 [Parasitella parasitica]|nr:hypothetical protein BD408DRAFT_55201 [Parasitella parasitica]